MQNNFGYYTTSFRFPGGAMGRGSDIISPRRALLAELGYREFGWDIDSGDANPAQSDRSAATLANNVLNNTRNRDHLIILMHDSGGRRTTLEALPAIIAGLREKGYSFDIMRNYPE
jgi:peptidoglycan/xylan/chitin deacetylase (PgdA/CDA1 family)